VRTVAQRRRRPLGRSALDATPSAGPVVGLLAFVAACTGPAWPRLMFRDAEVHGNQIAERVAEIGCITPDRPPFRTIGGEARNRVVHDR